ncbi:MAG: DinB family protein [Gemmatimonadales bacterium]
MNVQKSPGRYEFLVETYETERLKVLSTWSMFVDGDLPVRPHKSDVRGRSVHEQMVHQCVSEDIWLRTMLGIDVSAPPLPEEETRLEFIRRYAVDSGLRLEALRDKDDAWWEETVDFFEVRRTRAWVMTRRIAHTSHHRGQLAATLRMLNRELHSTYGPTSDTGGLMQNEAPTIYAYPTLEALLEGEEAGGAKSPLPGPGTFPPTERPG